MTGEDLKKLDDEIAAKRAAREKLMTDAEAMRVKAHALSKDIRDLEAALPSPKQRRGISMQADAAKVALKPRR